MTKLDDNIAAVRSFAALAPGWDGYGAEAITADVIARAIHVLDRLAVQPEVFPTGRGSVQLEFDTGTDSLEIEIRSGAVNFLVSRGGKDTEWVGRDEDIATVIGQYLGQA